MKSAADVTTCSRRGAAPSHARRSVASSRRDPGAEIGGTSGSWELALVADGGHHTLLTYRAWIDTDWHMPEFVERFLLQRALPNVIGDIRDEIERRFRDP